METSKDLINKIKKVNSLLEELAVTLGVLPNAPELGRTVLLQQNADLNRRTEQLQLRLANASLNRVDSKEEELIEELSKVLVRMRESHSGKVN